MGLLRHEVEHFRNLHRVTLEPVAGLNLISGPNASGKTSLLESIFFLSYGRSFRSGHSKDLIEYQQDYFRLVSSIDNNGAQSLLGIEKSGKHQIIKINQEPVYRITDLSRLLPVVAIHPDSHQLISAGPEQRRQFLDWGVFHVEHGFLQHWKTYKKVLSQRNAALRQQQDAKLCCLWDRALVDAAQHIHKARSDYCLLLTQTLAAYAACLFPDSTIELAYQSGWSQSMDLMEILHDQLDRDRQKGFTQSGPHRADLKIQVDGKPAQTSLSRGQQKKLVAMLKLSQMRVFLDQSVSDCILLYDDLPAELDRDNQAIVMGLLSEMDIQVFITAIESKELSIDGWSERQMFHVEHGELSS